MAKIPVKGKVTREYAYWVSPDNYVIPVPMKHIDVILSEPEKFGLTNQYIKKIHKKHKEPIGVEGNAREEIMASLIDIGWVRIRYRSREDSWTIQVSDLDKTVNSITGWAQAIKKFFPYSEVLIMDLKPDVLWSGDISDVAKGQIQKDLSKVYQSPFASFRENDLTLTFLKSISEYKNGILDELENYMIESSWSRIIQHITGNKSFAVISGYRETNTDSENLSLHKKLKSDVKKMDLGYIEQDSGYTYVDDKTGESEVKQERSLFIPNISYENAIKLGAKYNQESILFKDNDKFVLVYSTPTIDSSGNKHNVGEIAMNFKFKNDEDGKITFDPDVLKYAYSSLIRANKSQKGKQYAFVGAEEAIIPTRTESMLKRNTVNWNRFL